jgi:hypothetical protein
VLFVWQRKVTRSKGATLLKIWIHEFCTTHFNRYCRKFRRKSLLPLLGSQEAVSLSETSDYICRLPFEVLTAVSMETAVFWVVAPCRLVQVYRRFRGLYCLHLQGGNYTTCCSILEGRYCLSHACENLKAHHLHT